MTQDRKYVLHCLGCNQRLSVPQLGATLRVTCPQCRRQFILPPPCGDPERIEQSQEPQRASSDEKLQRPVRGLTGQNAALVHLLEEAIAQLTQLRGAINAIETADCGTDTASTSERDRGNTMGSGVYGVADTGYLDSPDDRIADVPDLVDQLAARDALRPTLLVTPTGLEQYPEDIAIICPVCRREIEVEEFLPEAGWCVSCDGINGQ